MAIQLVGQRFEYTLESDRASEKPTVFSILELNARQRRDVASAFIGIDALAKKSTQAQIDAKNDEVFEANLRVCRLGLLAAAPILDADGHAVDVSISQILDGIRSEAVIAELALAVIDANKLSAADKKKSPTRRKRAPQD